MHIPKAATMTATAAGLTALTTAIICFPGTEAAAEPSLRHCAGTEWIGSWAAAPSTPKAAEGAGSPRSLVEQTVRMVIRPTISGDTARVRLAHRDGASPARISSVSLARRNVGASAEPGTVRSVTFRGSPSLTIPAGADLMSDPVRLRVTAGNDLLVSIHVTGALEGPTEHFITNQTNYLSIGGTGDHTREQGGAHSPW